MALLQYIIKKHYLVLQKSKFQLTYEAIVSKSVSILPLKTAGKNSVLKNLQNLFFVRLISDPSWRNWLARSTVNRKVGGSSPPEGVRIFFPQLYFYHVFKCEIVFFQKFILVSTDILENGRRKKTFIRSS